jgi:DNA-binding FadR family transcriptional regulator
MPGAYTRTGVYRRVASVPGGEAADEAVALSIAEGSEALYSQIENRLREHTLRRRLPAGAVLPSFRGSARKRGRSTVTARRAYRDLEIEGMLRSRRGLHTVFPFGHRHANGAR